MEAAPKVSNFLGGKKKKKNRAKAKMKKHGGSSWPPATGELGHDGY